MRDWFRRFAHKTSSIVGSTAAFALSALIIIIWVACVPTFHFSDTWQLVINTSTTIITFLMVFLILNNQNRDAGAIQLKLDKLIRANEVSRNLMIDLEELADEELDRLHVELCNLKEIAEIKTEKAFKKRHKKRCKIKNCAYP